MTTTDSKLPPHNIEAEEAVLGSVLVDPNRLVEVGAIVVPADFYREKNAWIFEAMLPLGNAVNQITVAEALLRQGKLEQIGGVGFLSLLVERCVTSLHAEHYAKIVNRLAYCRKAIHTGAMIAAIGYEAKGTPTEVFEKCHEALNEMQPSQITDIVSPTDHANRLFGMLMHRKDKTEAAVTMGWPGLDRFLGGLYPGNFVVIGARPYMGKSQILQEIALNNTVIRDGDPETKVLKKALIASAEMSVEEFDEREIAGFGVPIDRLRSGQLEQTEWDKVFNLVGELAHRPMYFLEGRLTIDHIYQRAQLLQRTEGLDLIIIDYIQLLRDTVTRKGDSATRDKVSAISAGMKQMAQELKVPVVTASQLNREVEFRKDKMPVLADLRESGTIEQDADVVIMLTRPEVYDPDDEPGVLYLNVAKARQIGRTRLLRFIWRENHHCYGEMADTDPLPGFRG